ncbi:MAG: Lysophospholipase; Monoglyceride lipase; putative [uncultured Thermomicrobiales bacterium]|uniref:Lysophospholipase Monoglyceride lipase putative n=1 Tax=uncultured Thermomicrobiales bacterium TaxID=1645740 RepID=A0A6J4TUW2_9BACT|nr:MAG: Lysophospholipase; Monoglyceride lipase; putative [uncultured Thermomicrobiales bacterium]
MAQAPTGAAAAAEPLPAPTTAAEPEVLSLAGGGGVRLYGAVWRPAGSAGSAGASAAPRATVLLAHGYGEHLGRYAHVVAALTAGGYAVAGLDHRGHGQSAGRRADVVRFDDYVADLDVLARHARATVATPGARLFLLGHSMGGLIAVRYALRHGTDPAVALAGLALSGAALSIGNDVSPALRRASGILARLVPTLPVVRAGEAGILSRDPEVERRFGLDPLTYKGKLRARMGHQMVGAAADATARLGDLTLPLLAMHGADDKLTDPDGTVLAVEVAASADKTLKLWPGLRHELFNEPERAEVLAYLLAWLDARS